MESELAKRLFERVRRLREERGFTQESFAEETGLDYKHYQGIEAGRRKDFRLSTLEKIAKGLGLAPWQLLRLDEMAVGEAKAEYGSRPAKRRRKS